MLKSTEIENQKYKKKYKTRILKKYEKLKTEEKIREKKQQKQGGNPQKKGKQKFKNPRKLVLRKPTKKQEFFLKKMIE